MTAKIRTRPKLRLLSDAGGESVSFGSWLRRQREVRDISLREIAESSKISLRYLEAFEQDRFDILPARVFAQGFLREYAKYVGLDPDEVVNHYIASQQDVEPDEDGEASAEVKRPAASSNWWFHVLLVLGVAATLVLAALLAFQTERNRSRAPGPATEPAVETERPSLPPPPADVGSEVEPAAPPLAPAPEPTETGPIEPSPAPAVASAPLLVRLRFRERCYAEISVDGARLAPQEHPAGEVVDLAAEREVRLTLGNAGGVDVEVNGRPYALGRGRGQVARDVRIDLETARSLAEAP